MCDAELFHLNDMTCLCWHLKEVYKFGLSGVLFVDILLVSFIWIKDSVILGKKTNYTLLTCTQIYLAVPV